MINLYPLPGPLHRHHQDLVDAGLPEDLRAQAFSEISFESHDAASIARGRAAWQSRALEALGLVRRYVRFSADVTEIGVGSEFLGLATRAVWDRNCHLELCCRMVQALGGTLKLRTEGSMLNDPKAETSKMRCHFAYSQYSVCLEYKILYGSVFDPVNNSDHTDLIL